MNSEELATLAEWIQKNPNVGDLKAKHIELQLLAEIATQLARQTELAKSTYQYKK